MTLIPLVEVVEEVEQMRQPLRCCRLQSSFFARQLQFALPNGEVEFDLDGKRE